MRQSFSFLCGFSKKKKKKKGLRLQIILSFSKLESFNITGFKISSLQPQNIPVFQPNSPRIFVVNYNTEKGGCQEAKCALFMSLSFLKAKAKSNRADKMVSTCVLTILHAVFISDISSPIFSIS